MEVQYCVIGSRGVFTNLPNIYDGGKKVPPIMLDRVLNMTLKTLVKVLATQ